MKLVEFTRDMRPYRAGDAYALPDAAAAQLIAGGDARPAPGGDAGLAPDDPPGARPAPVVQRARYLTRGKGAAVVSGALAIAALLLCAGQWNAARAQQAMGMCTLYAKVHVTTATDTQIVAPAAGQNIYVCDYEFSAAGADNFYLESATASSCGGSLSQLTILWTLATNESKSATNPFYRGINGGFGNGLCVNTSAAQGFDIGVYYDQTALQR